MYKQIFSARGVRCAVAAGLFSGTISAPWVYAQTAPSGAGTTASNTSPLEEVVVTGTRIARPEEAFANPVVAISAESIARSGRTNIAELLDKSPALLASQAEYLTGGSETAIGETGVDLLNLRNLGVDRTLVLVDGRRHVAGVEGRAGVDINAIPVDLIESIDVLTGGASAIYGADGVSGVVNFRLKHNFEGVNARVQAGTSTYGDGSKRFGALTFGHNFAENRGNAAIAVEYHKEDRVSDVSRNYYLNPSARHLLRNQDDLDDDPNVPDNIPYRDVRYVDSSHNGAFDVDGDGAPDYQGNGLPYNRGLVLEQSGGYASGGNSSPVDGYQGDLFPALQRYIVNGLGHFDVTDRFSLFAEGKFAQTKAHSLAQPTFDSFIAVRGDNPFMPDTIRSHIVPGAAAEVLGDDTIDPDSVLLTGRDNFDLGINTEDVRRRTLRGVVGANGQISEHAKFEVSYVYGEAKLRTLTRNNRIESRWQAAIDAVTDPVTGDPVCRSSLNPDADPGLAGCVPYNIYGDGVADPAAKAFVLTDDISNSTLTQKVVSGSISGDFGTFLQLPGGAVEYAIGAEYRREHSKFRPDELLQSGDSWAPQLTPSSGGFNVKEVFAETNFPIVKDRPWAHLFSIGGAYRFSDYSTVGHTSTWKIDTVYAPTAVVSFRGTYSQAVRAPNISELFAPQSGTFDFVTDPCDVNELNNGSSFREANCAQILQGLGIDPATYEPSTSTLASIAKEGTVSGNTGLSEEKAKTWTAGIVWKPDSLRGFSFTADWYDIKIKNAINTATFNEIVNLCVDQPTLNNAFCPDVDRDPTNGFVSGVRIQPQNVANFRTAGLDATINYLLNTDSHGSFSTQLVGGYVNKLTKIASPGAEPINELGQYFYTSPRYAATFETTWKLNRVGVTYGLNYFSRTNRFTDPEINGDPDEADRKYLKIKELWEHNIQVDLDVTDRVSVWAGVNNLFNQKPDFDPGYRSYPASALGQFFYAGAKASF